MNDQKLKEEVEKLKLRVKNLGFNNDYVEEVEDKNWELRQEVVLLKGKIESLKASGISKNCPYCSLETTSEEGVSLLRENQKLLGLIAKFLLNNQRKLTINEYDQMIKDSEELFKQALLPTT